MDHKMARSYKSNKIIIKKAHRRRRRRRRTIGPLTRDVSTCRLHPISRRSLHPRPSPLEHAAGRLDEDVGRWWPTVSCCWCPTRPGPPPPLPARVVRGADPCAARGHQRGTLPACPRAAELDLHVPAGDATESGLHAPSGALSLIGTCTCLGLPPSRTPYGALASRTSTYAATKTAHSRAVRGAGLPRWHLRRRRARLPARAPAEDAEPARPLARRLRLQYLRW
ncbi:unnamed protein product [Urochloa humidicola]